MRDLPADKARKIIQEIGAKRPAMANLTRAVLRRMFSFAVTIGRRRDNPFDEIPKYKIGTHHTWTEAELTLTSSAGPSAPVNALPLSTALLVQRVGDAVRMQRSDIRNGVMTVTQQKTGTEVFVELHPALARSIKAGPSNGVYLIGDRNGRPLTRRTLSVLIVAEGGQAAECIAHGLRKARLRRLAEHGATSKEMQALRSQDPRRDRALHAIRQIRSGGERRDRWLPDKE